MSTDLVPLIVALNTGQGTFKENFLWNASSSSSQAMLQAALQLCREAGLPASLADVMVDSMRRQIASYKRISAGGEDAEELLKPIKLTIQVGDTVLQDQFYWDVNKRDSDPEGFARQLCRELRLSMRFAPKIAFSIREQVLEYRRELSTTPPAAAEAPADHDVSRQRKQPDSDNIMLAGSLRSIYESSVCRRRSDWALWAPKVQRLPDALPRERPAAQEFSSLQQVLPAAADSMRSSAIAAHMQGQPGPRELLPSRHPLGHNQLDLQVPSLQPYQATGHGEGSQEDKLLSVQQQQQLLHYEALKQAHLATQWLGRPGPSPSQTGLTPSLGSVSGGLTHRGELPAGPDATPQRVLPRLPDSTPSLKFWKQQQHQQQLA